MSAARHLFARARGKSGGFSLVEVTIAIGIFAFVVVAILGLFPTALRQRSDAALETRSVMVARQVFSGLQGSPDTNRIFLPPLVQQSTDIDGVRVCESRALADFPITLRFGERGTTPLAPGTPNEWGDGSTEVGVDALARVTIEVVPGYNALYRATVDYGRPAALAEGQRRNFSFTKLVYLP